MRIWPGATVQGRKRKLNPMTHSGRPFVNTYAKLDVMPTTWQAGNGKGVRGLKGHSHHATPPRRLDKNNLCHRKGGGYQDHVLEQARVLSLQLDHGPSPRRQDRYHELVRRLDQVHLAELVGLEAKRGVTRAAGVVSHPCPAYIRGL